MEKYYTPKIEEFHVGFEYEQASMKMAAPKKWHKEIFYLNDSHIDIVKYGSLDKNTRVKYLDKEDIESLGFKHIGAGWFESKELDCRVRKWKGLEVDIYKNWSHLNVTEQNELKCFTGEIKNKSELKKLLKQLSI